MSVQDLTAELPTRHFHDGVPQEHFSCLNWAYISPRGRNLSIFYSFLSHLLINSHPFNFFFPSNSYLNLSTHPPVTASVQTLFFFFGDTGA
jgi:hypothetical protein